MRTTIYRFGRFRLNPQARELDDGGRRVALPVSTIDCLIYLIEHRDRPVGRDELASAVWGRADVSDVSLSHAVMRLRRLLGDTGNEQRVIRTVPRLGYRWVFEETIEESATAISAAPPVASGDDEARATFATKDSEGGHVASDIEPGDATRAPHSNLYANVQHAKSASRSSRAKRVRVSVSLLIVVVTAASIAAIVTRTHREERAAATTGARTAIVMPATLDAPADAIWMRFGLMDLVASRLRSGGFATLPSEAVVAMTKSRDALPDALGGDGTLVVRPEVGAVRGAWRVRLEAQDGRRTLRAEKTADDAVAAARAAADDLLIKLGHAPPPGAGDLSDAASTLRQRVTAAVFSGQLDIARRLIADAPPALKSTPEIAISEARVEFFAGDYAKSRAIAGALLDRLPADASPALRGRIMNTLGAAFFREGTLDEAARAYAESIRLNEGGAHGDVLANAYIGRGGVASQRMRLDEAAADYGRARTLLDLGNDAFGVAAVDLNLGIVELHRGEASAARETLRAAASRFESFAADDALSATLEAIVDADVALLDPNDALAVAERLTALQSRGDAGRERLDVVLARAQALAGAGRFGEADTLLARIDDTGDPVRDARLRAEAAALGAETALARGDCAHAAELAAAAMTPVLATSAPADHARAARIGIEAMLCAGDVADAKLALDRLRASLDGMSAAAGGIERLRAEAAIASASASADVAADAWSAAMDAARKSGSPDVIVGTALDAVRALIAARRIDAAASINGRTAAFAGADARASLIEALVYRALGRDAAADEALARTRRLAGERTFAELGSETGAARNR
jgi:DNA-binding winged helix-turn-helix (wHTH) protein/tetratricopeptide (TPR) repeat protein